MAKAVGLSRPIKLEWLNKTVELIKLGKPEIEIGKDLQDYLSYEIKDITNLNKTKSSLMKIWVKVSPNAIQIRDKALICLDNEKANREAIHWCMILLAYPVFVDVCSMIGKIINIQDEFTTAWIKEKLLESWGERTTLYYSIDKILKTIKNLDAIDNIKIGLYRAKPVTIIDNDTITVLIMTILSINEKAYYEIADISSAPQMFPFKFEVSHEWLHNSNDFSLNNFGGKVVLVKE